MKQENVQPVPVFGFWCINISNSLSSLVMAFLLLIFSDPIVLNPELKHEIFILFHLSPHTTSPLSQYWIKSISLRLFFIMFHYIFSLCFSVIHVGNENKFSLLLLQYICCIFWPFSRDRLVSICIGKSCECFHQ